MNTKGLVGLLLITFIATGSIVYQLRARRQRASIVTPAPASGVPAGSVSASPPAPAVPAPEPESVTTTPVNIPSNGWGRNPFLTIDEINKALQPPPLVAAAPVVRPVEPPVSPSYDVTAIIAGSQGFLAVVGDRLVQPGDKLGQETVKSITRNGVVLESEGRTRELPLRRLEDTVKKKETKQP